MASSTTVQNVDASEDSWAPTFLNRPAGSKERRARIHLYQKKMVLQKKPQEGIINFHRTFNYDARVEQP